MAHIEGDISRDDRYCDECDSTISAPLYIEDRPAPLTDYLHEQVADYYAFDESIVSDEYRSTGQCIGVAPAGSRWVGALIVLVATVAGILISLNYFYPERLRYLTPVPRVIAERIEVAPTLRAPSPKMTIVDKKPKTARPAQQKQARNSLFFIYLLQEISRS